MSQYAENCENVTRCERCLLFRRLPEKALWGLCGGQWSKVDEEGNVTLFHVDKLGINKILREGSSAEFHPNAPRVHESMGCVLNPDVSFTNG